MGRIGKAIFSAMLTAVRRAAGQELGGGAAAFLGQVNSHLYVLHPLFHLGPRTGGGQMDVRYFQATVGRRGTEVKGQASRVTWQPRRWTGAGPAG